MSSITELIELMIIFNDKRCQSVQGGLANDRKRRMTVTEAKVEVTLKITSRKRSTPSKASVLLVLPADALLLK